MRPTDPRICIKVFISYAREDKKLHQKLKDHLCSLEHSGQIEIWQDQEIQPGGHWQEEINKHLNEADLILLLVSSRFIASKYCWDNEVQKALKRHRAGTARVVPVILKPVHWRDTPLGQLQALPKDAKPVTQWDDRDDALENVVQGIRKVVEDLSKRPEEPQIYEGVPFEGRKAALIVGVNNTQCSSLLPNLKCAEDDAHKIAYVLQTPACSFACLQTALTGENAKTQEVRVAVVQLAQQTTAQDFLLFYFLGHALPIRTKEGYTDIYLVTSDFNEEVAIKEASAHLSLRWLQGLLYQSKSAARVLIILDCCYMEKIIGARSDHYSVNVSQLLKECIGPPSIMDQNGRWRFVLTASTYTTPAQERMMTGLLLSALQGTGQDVADPNGYIYVASLYTYLQRKMPQEQFPDLAVNFPQTCIIASYNQFPDRFRLEALQIETDNLGTQISKLSGHISELYNLITDPEFFKRFASPSFQGPAEYFDHCIAEKASLDDLHRDKFTDFFASDVVRRQKDFRLGASSQDQLQFFGFLRQMCPTYGALLCFGFDPAQWLPGASTRCTLWSGNEKHNRWLDKQEYRDDLIAQFESGRSFLQKHLRSICEIGRDERSEQLEIPLTALGEALANALVHREYKNSTASVFIDIFDNRVEISNPGTLPEPMRLDLLEEEHKSHPRNPQIARIFYLHQYVENVGSGIQRMQNLLKNAGLEPAKFELSKDKIFKVIFHRPQQSAEEFAPLPVAIPVTDPSIGHQSVTPPKGLSSPNLMRRRTIVIAGLAIGVVSLGGAAWWATRPQPTCNPSPSLTSTPIASGGLLTPGVLLWGADPSPGGAPYVFYDANSALVGFEVEIATAIANRMGITQQCYPAKYKWENEQDLQARHIDIILNGWKVTQKRQQDESFSTPYYRSSQQLVVRANDPRFSQYTTSSQITLAELKKYKFGTGADYKAADLLRGAGIEPSTSFEDPLKALEGGIVDIVLIDSPIVIYYVEGKGIGAKPSDTLRAIGKPLFTDSTSNYVIGLKKDDPNAETLRKEIDQVLFALKQDGTLKSIYQRWGLWNELQKEIGIGDPCS